jgi:hypothetical protein
MVSSVEVRLSGLKTTTIPIDARLRTSSTGGKAVHWTQIRHFGILAFLTLLVMLVPREAAATLPAPNQPILLVQDSTSADPYQNFVPELLKPKVSMDL